MKCLNHGKGLVLGYSGVCVCVLLMLLLGKQLFLIWANKRPFGPRHRFIQNTGLAFSEEPFRSFPLV